MLRHSSPHLIRLCTPKPRQVRLFHDLIQLFLLPKRTMVNHRSFVPVFPPVSLSGTTKLLNSLTFYFPGSQKTPSSELAFTPPSVDRLRTPLFILVLRANSRVDTPVLNPSWAAPARSHTSTTSSFPSPTGRTARNSGFSSSGTKTSLTTAC